MSPSSLIFFTILFIPILLLVIVALLWKRARILLLIFAIAVASGEVYYLLYAKEASLQEWYEHEASIEAHLTKTYPDDEWIIRKEMGSPFFSNGVEVIFIDELEVAYLYIVENDDVSLVGYSMVDGNANPKREQ